MTDTAIRVVGLGKQFQIGAKQEKYRTLRDAMMTSLSGPAKQIRRVVRGGFSAASKPRDTIWALRDVNFDIARGEVIGVIGRNGAGKSTLLKVLSGITEPTLGYADVYGRIGSLLEVGTGFHPELTGRENIYLNGAILGMQRTEIERKFDEIVAFSEVEAFVDTPVKRYSSGMYLRLAFAVAAHLDPEIMLVDEVLAVGDLGFQRKCLGKMGEVASAGRTVLFVSHNLDAIMSLCPRTIVMEKGQVVFDGPTATAVMIYGQSTENAGTSAEAHVIYEAPDEAEGSDIQITRIELLDEDGNPAPVVQTWDKVCFRLHYTCKRAVASGSFILDIVDYKEQRLAVFDSGLHLDVATGTHTVDCVIDCLPLSAGEYYISAGIGLSNSQWLWRKERLGLFRVYGRDVFNINRPPLSSRMLFAVAHEWRDGVRDPAQIPG